jgi:predicted nucleic acid-binding protein
VSAVSVAELFVRPVQAGPAAVAVVDAFLRQPLVGVAEVGEEVARIAAGFVATSRLARLPDALIAATAASLELPLVTGDRGWRSARAASSWPTTRRSDGAKRPRVRRPRGGRSWQPASNRAS